MVGSTEVPCCCQASRRGEIKRPGTIVMTNMNVLMANLTILDFRSALGLNNIDKSPRSNQAGLLSSTSHGYLQCRSENLVCTFFSSSASSGAIDLLFPNQLNEVACGIQFRL